MKELSIEEKAKAYDRVREKIALRFGTDVAEGIFSEFEESEDDRIRKALIEMVHDTTGDELWVDYNIHKEDALAWLEKQGKVESDNDDIEVEEKGIREAFNKIEDEKQCKQKPQRMISAEAKEAMYNKPADTVEPKFKIGDSIKTANEEPLTITEITDNGYWSEDLFICNFDDAAKWELVEQKPADKVEPKCEESKTKIYDAPTSFENRLFAFVAGCELLTLPAKIEFIKEHSQELLDAAKEQTEKKHEEDMELIKGLLEELNKKTFKPPFTIKTFPESKPSDQFKPFDPWGHVCVYACPTAFYDPNITISTTDTLNEEGKL